MIVLQQYYSSSRTLDAAGFSAVCAAQLLVPVALYLMHFAVLLCALLIELYRYFVLQQYHKIILLYVCRRFSSGRYLIILL